MQRTVTIAWLCCAGLMLLAGCRPSTTNDGAPNISDRPQPVTISTGVGLELQRIVVDSTGGQLGFVLRDYAGPNAAIDEATQQRLRDSGLRCLVVPRADLPVILARMRTIGSVEREWLGQLQNWTPIAHSIDATEPSIMLDNGPVNLVAGRLRLLGRSWIVPHVSPEVPEAPDTQNISARLHIELVPQHEPTYRRHFDQLLESRLRSIEDDGQIFRRLRLGADLDSDSVLIVVPEDPKVDWSDVVPVIPEQQEIVPEQVGPQADPPQPAANPNDTADLPSRPVFDRPLRIAGPQEPQPRSLGEQLLRSEAQRTLTRTGAFSTRQERSVVLIFIPNVPAQYRLLP